MRLVSWNVNGIRAVMKKNFLQTMESMAPDVIGLQETKAQSDQVLDALAELEGFSLYTHSAVRKGYSGCALLSREPPHRVVSGLGLAEHDQEGRVICAEYDAFFVVVVYTPNSGNGLKRLPYRQSWDAAFLRYLRQLEADKPVVVCGDLNVAHREIDLARPKANYNKTAGFTQQEIDGMDKLQEAGFVDSYRYLHPDTVKYSWWSYRAGARERNVGWRIDYILTSQELVKHYVAADIHTDINGSDHCPVSLELRTPEG